jgi:hypothetical protein
MANWGEMFGEAFSKSYGNAQENANKFREWQEEQNKTKDVYTIGQDGKPMLSGVVPAGSQVISPTFMMTPQDKVEMEQNKIEQKAQKSQLSTARKSFDAYSSDAMQALTALDKIEKYSTDLPQFGRGVLAQTKAKVTTGVSQYAKEKNITRYLGTLAQELIPMARKLMEEKGPITEFDVARVEKGFGDLTTPQEDRIVLIGELRNKVKQAIMNKMDVSEYSFKDIASKYKMLGEKVFGKTMKFKIGSDEFDIPLSEVDDFKKEMGI